MMFGIQTSQNEDDLNSTEKPISLKTAQGEQEKSEGKILKTSEKLELAIDAFKRRGNWQRTTDAAIKHVDLLALSFVYDLYLDFHDNSDRWSEFLQGLDLTIAPQTKYPVSPIIAFLFGFTKCAADKTKQSHWAATIQFAIEKGVKQDDFVETIERHGGVYAVTKLLKDNQKSEQDREIEQKANDTAEALYSKIHQPVPVPTAGVIADMAAGYHLVIFKVDESGSGSIVSRVNEKSSKVRKRHIKIVTSEETDLAN